MAKTSSPLGRNLHALLIGIDYYDPNVLPDGGYYPSLGGCVRDINLVEQFLKQSLGIPANQIKKITSTNGPNGKAVEPRKQLPTYANMVAAWKDLISRAKKGDQVYIHYSGHGGRSATAYPDLKGKTGLDESLVPVDIGSKKSRYLADIEIAHLIKQMVDKGLIPTIVFDSCHSGGATRGSEGAVRGISSIDTTKRPKESLVADAKALAKTWKSIQPEQTRAAQLSSGWQFDTKNTVLLAACRANELANEFAFEGTERNGALTYWLLNALKQVSPGLTFEMLHDRILARIHAKFPQQTPQLQGNGSRVVFDVNQVLRPPSVRVIGVEGKNKIKLEAGEIQGIGVGAHFAIYAADTTDFTSDAAQLAVVEVKDVQSSESTAEVVEGKKADTIVEGAQAVLLDSGSMRFRGRTRLTRRGDLPKGVAQEKALKAVEKEIKQSKWVKLADAKESADFQVAVNANGEYEIWEPSGRAINNLRPAIKISEPNAAATLTARLVHLTKYSNVRLIDNPSNASSSVQVSMKVKEETGKGPGGSIVVDEGQVLTIKITNTSRDVINFTVLDIQPDWGITQLYPPDKDSEILDPNDSVELPVKFDLPADYKEGTDTIKVFATEGNTNFRWLELPALDKPLQGRSAQSRTRGGPSNPLEDLLAGFANEAPPEKKTRAALAFSVSASKWATAQLDIQAKRRPTTIKHVRDVSTSLLQAAFEQVAVEQSGGKRARSGPGQRPSVADPAVAAITEYLADPAGTLAEAEGEKRGILDTAKYCAGLAAGVAKEFWNAKLKGDTKKYEQYKKALTVKFGGCDPNFAKAVEKYVEFLSKHGEVPYRRWKQLSDFVIESGMPVNATIGLVADWATGQSEAIEVLRQVRAQNPHVVFHLGDTYYAGTEQEMQDYFVKPWVETLKLDTTILSSFITPGNHDLYSGGQPFYDVIDKFGQPASYFCLRNKNWQLIGLDTAMNDRLGNEMTWLEDTEVKWLKDKMKNSGGRRTVLLSHHQLFSSNEKFGGKSYNEKLYAQLKPILPDVDLWLWGHEHDLVVFEEFMGLKRARCIGGSAFPVGKFELPDVAKNPDVPYNKQVMLSKGDVFYQHCYAVMRLNGPNAVVEYYEDGGGGRLLFSESL